MGKFIDLSGQKFGKLLVIKRVPNNCRRTMWLCKCDCGNEKAIRGEDLHSGRTVSCGCYAKTIHKTHGFTHTKIHNTWGQMKKRCFDKNDPDYRRYGDRGITVCDRWRDSFEAFYKDVSILPHFGEKGYTLNRIDNNGNYEPNNVEWADNITQSNNKQNNRLITYNGKTQTIAQWADELKIKHQTLSYRLNHWNIENVFERPVNTYKKKGERNEKQTQDYSSLD